MRKAPSLLAAIGLLCFVAPLAQATAMVAHLAHEEDHELGDHADDLGSALHGHAHPDGAPSHDHDSVAPPPVSRLTAPHDLAQPLLVASLAAGLAFDHGLIELVAAKHREDRALRGLPPPSLLSPILRI